MLAENFFPLHATAMLQCLLVSAVHAMSGRCRHILCSPLQPPGPENRTFLNHKSMDEPAEDNAEESNIVIPEPFEPNASRYSGAVQLQSSSSEVVIIDSSKSNCGWTSDGMWISVSFGGIFVLLVLASLYAFWSAECSLRRQKQQETDGKLSRNQSRPRTYTQSIDFVSSSEARRSRSMSMISRSSSECPSDFVMEATTSVTAPTKRWLKTELLGRGRFGAVHLCIDWESPTFRTRDVVRKLYAVKRATFATDANGKHTTTKECLSIYDEMRVLAELQHKHIVHFYGSAVSGRAILMFLEYVDMGNLSQILKECGSFDLITTRLFVRQLLSAIGLLSLC